MIIMLYHARYMVSYARQQIIFIHMMICQFIAVSDLRGVKGGTPHLSGGQNSTTFSSLIGILHL